MYKRQTDIIELPPYRNYGKADWNQFQLDMGLVQIYTPQTIDQKKLDKMVHKITHVIEEITEKCCPTMPAKQVNKNNPWWTPQMNYLRKEVNALYRNYLRKQDDITHTNYRQVLRKYKNLRSKAKNKHRKRTNEIIPDESSMAKHIKSLTEQICPQIGSVIKPCLLYTSPSPRD